MKSFLQSFSKLFCRRLKYRGLYAIHSGDLVGAFFVYIEEEDRGNTYAILTMPEPMQGMYVKQEEIIFDLKYKNIRFVRKLPRDVYDVCKVNFTYYAKKAGIYANR